MTRLIIAKTAGFCFGVARAVSLAERALETGSCYCLGQLIHNESVVSALEKRGMITVSGISQIPDNARVIIRSHGAAREEYDELAKKNAEIIDLTCPKVKKIHDIVKNASKAGKQVIIIGEKDHPEVRAICGWCESPLVTDNIGELEGLLRSAEAYPGKSGGSSPDNGAAVVFQTTQTRALFSEVCDLIKKECTNTEIFDTICGATYSRQLEAAALAEKCGAMIIIGDSHSGNSARLFSICRQKCAEVQFISRADELNIDPLKEHGLIGITAGASAPARIIKEVIQKMNDEIKIEDLTTQDEAIGIAEPENIPTEETTEKIPEQPAAPADITPEQDAAPADITPAQDAFTPVIEAEKSFDELLEDSIRTIYNGETVTGIVAAITPTEISVDLGTKHSGYIPASEFEGDGEGGAGSSLKIGDTIEAIAVRVNDVEGTVMLSKKRLDAVKGWDEIELARESGTAVEGTVTEENKGGVVVSVHGLRVFVPASQSGLGRDEPMSQLLKQKVRLKITEVNRSRRRIVGSIRAVSSRERREKADTIWNDIEVGKRYDGVVKSITSYGAFVDVGGIDGMVHITELSWSKPRHPSEIVTVGDPISVYVIAFDKDTRKISLGYKDKTANPWNKFIENHKKGDVIPVKINKLAAFGAFAEIIPGVDGLIHISQLSDQRIQKASEVVREGDEITVRITNIDEQKQKISLSVRALSEPEAAEPVSVSSDDTSPSAGDAASSFAKPAPESDALVYEVSSSGEATGNTPEEE